MLDVCVGEYQVDLRVVAFQIPGLYGAGFCFGRSLQSDEGAG